MKTLWLCRFGMKWLKWAHDRIITTIRRDERTATLLLPLSTQITVLHTFLFVLALQNSEARHYRSLDGVK
jgi:hypothetical protein